MEYFGIHVGDLVHQTFRTGQDGRHHLGLGHALIEVGFPRGKSTRVGIAVKHVLVDLVDKRLVRGTWLRGPTRAATTTTEATEERLVSVVEVGIDLGREIDGSDMLRGAAVFRAQLGVEVDVGDAVARTDSLDRVETPMDAEENAASGVLRGSLAEAGGVPVVDPSDRVQSVGADSALTSRR